MAQAQKSSQIEAIEAESGSNGVDQEITANPPIPSPLLGQSVKLQQAKIASLVLSGIGYREIAELTGHDLRTCERIANKVESELAELNQDSAISLMTTKFGMASEHHRTICTILTLEGARLSSRIDELEIDSRDRPKLLDRQIRHHKDLQEADSIYFNTLKAMGVSHLMTGSNSMDPIHTSKNNNLQLEATYRVIKDDPDAVRKEIRESAQRLIDYVDELGD